MRKDFCRSCGHIKAQHKPVPIHCRRGRTIQESCHCAKYIPPCCELCERDSVKLTSHHLIPKTLHGRKSFRKKFTKDEMRNRQVNLCEACHMKVHKTITEKELGLNYNTLDSLRAHPEIEKFIE